MTLPEQHLPTLSSTGVPLVLDAWYYSVGLLRNFGNVRNVATLEDCRVQLREVLPGNFVRVYFAAGPKAGDELAVMDRLLIPLDGLEAYLAIADPAVVKRIRASHKHL